MIVIWFSELVQMSANMKEGAHKKDVSYDSEELNEIRKKIKQREEELNQNGSEHDKVHVHYDAIFGEI